MRTLFLMLGLILSTSALASTSPFQKWTLVIVHVAQNQNAGSSVTIPGYLKSESCEEAATQAKKETDVKSAYCIPTDF